MTTAWVAGAVRAKALARRRLGAAGARVLATSPTLAEALATLATTPYGHDVRVDQTLAEAQHAIGATLLWHLRVLAGWLPREGADTMRVLAGGFEVANVDEHVRRLRGDSTEPPYRLGTLQTAWSRLAETVSPAAVREVLTASPWGDPGGESPWALHVGMCLAWADRVAGRVPHAAGWATDAAALLVVREVVLGGRRLPEGSAETAARVLGAGFAQTALARVAVLQNTTTPPSRDDLWRAEVAWWRRVDREGFALLRRARFEVAPVVGCVAVLAADAWRVRAALEVAARGGVPVEAFDVVA